MTAQQVATVVRHVMVSGRVQGVGYRQWCAFAADHHAVRGWVRNRANGAVEAVFAGAADAVDRLVAACRTGPPGARVDDILVHEASETALAAGGRDRFVILPTV